jgi:hypothetical protein
LWLAHRYADSVVFSQAHYLTPLFSFNPIFVLPVSETVDIPSTDSNLSAPTTHSPGRRTGTGSANISSSNRAPSARKRVLGFRKVSLFTILPLTGNVPPFSLAPETPSSLDDIRRNADRPVVIFPECTTSNGRGMLRFADIFRGENVPVKKFRLFIMCVR